MAGLQTILKMLGVEVTEEHVQFVEQLIPQLPGKINEIVQAINGCLINFDGRLKALETHQAEINRKLDLLIGEQNGRGFSNDGTDESRGTGHSESEHNGHGASRGVTKSILSADAL